MKTLRGNHYQTIFLPTPTIIELDDREFYMFARAWSDEENGTPDKPDTKAMLDDQVDADRTGFMDWIWNNCEHAIEFGSPEWDESEVLESDGYSVDGNEVWLTTTTNEVIEITLKTKGATQ